MGKFGFIEHTADVAIEVEGSSLEDLFLAAYRGWFEITLNHCTVDKIHRRKLSLTSGSPEELLVDFLSEINFFLTGEYWVCGDVTELQINRNEGQWKLKAVLQGEPFRPETHEIQVEIKAVTFHQLKIEKYDNKFRTLIVFDT